MKKRFVLSQVKGGGKGGKETATEVYDARRLYLYIVCKVSRAVERRERERERERGGVEINLLIVSSNECTGIQN